MSRTALCAARWFTGPHLRLLRGDVLVQLLAQHRHALPHLAERAVVLRVPERAAAHTQQQHIFARRDQCYWVSFCVVFCFVLFCFPLPGVVADGRAVLLHQPLDDGDELAQDFLVVLLVVGAHAVDLCEIDVLRLHA